MNYYVLLGVPQDADVDTIRRAFRTLARRYHPDAGEGSSAERFRQILTAYETLNDPTQRLRYDRTLQDIRAARAKVVEPLRAERFPEPMLRPGPRVGRTNPSHETFDQARLDQLIDELFHSWDEILFGAARRQDRG